MGIVYRLIILAVACGIAWWLRRKRGVTWSAAILIGIVTALAMFGIGEFVRP